MNNLVKEMERHEVLRIQSKGKRFSPNEKLNEMKTHMARLELYKKTGKDQKRGYYDHYKNECPLDNQNECQLEGYKKTGKDQKIGYYDHYKNECPLDNQNECQLEGYKKTCKDQKIGYYVQILNSYWENMVEEATIQPQKQGAAFRTKWLYAGTNYRRMVEPLVIAEYYRGGRNDYVNRGRSEHFRKLEEWLKDEKNPASKVKKNVEPLLTIDSCFWAHVEEALISSQKLKAEGSSVAEKKDARDKLEEFENYVYELLSKSKVSPEIFLEKSSYILWWREYIGIMGNSYDSKLGRFMRNPANFELYAKGDYDFPSLLH